MLYLRQHYDKNSFVKSFIEFEILLVMNMKRTVFRVANGMHYVGRLIIQRNLSPLYLEMNSQLHKKLAEAQHRKLRSACCAYAVQNI
jgi:hypothetical protein